MFDVDEAIQRTIKKEEEIEQARIAQLEERKKRRELRALHKYKPGDEWLKSRLEKIKKCLMREAPPAALDFWFKHDTWASYEGLVILCGYDPANLAFDSNGEISLTNIRGPLYGFKQLNGLSLDDNNLENAIGANKILWMRSDFLCNYTMILRFWKSGAHSQERYSPRYFIDWAKKKDVAISWLTWAEKQGYYRDEKELISNDVAGKSETSYLNIIGALCDLYWRTVHPDNPKFKQSEMLEALEKYADYPGLKERNLKEKISKGIKVIRNE